MSGIGAKITLTDEMRADIELFSESNGRWIVQVAKGLEDDFAERFKRATKIGDVGDMVSFSKDNKIIAEFEIEELRNAWKAPVWERLA